MKTPALHTSSVDRAACDRRAAALATMFRDIERTRMAGVPLLHPGLSVEAIGFELEGENAAAGVLLTPWFMNLVWFPLIARATSGDEGRVEGLQLGSTRFDAIGAYEPAFGAYSACSLFSPMFEFADQAAATATARAILDSLRTVVVAPVAEVAPARRAFLLGRTHRIGATT